MMMMMMMMLLLLLHHGLNIFIRPQSSNGFHLNNPRTFNVQLAYTVNKTAFCFNEEISVVSYIFKQ
jgi:hypothetical protein